MISPTPETPLDELIRRTRCLLRVHGKPGDMDWHEAGTLTFGSDEFGAFSNPSGMLRIWTNEGVVYSRYKDRAVLRDEWRNVIKHECVEAALGCIRKLQVLDDLSCI